MNLHCKVYLRNGYALQSVSKKNKRIQRRNSRFFTISHCAANRLLHVVARAQSCAIHVQHIERLSRATSRVTCHLVRRDSSYRIYLSFILLAEPLTDEGGEETGVPGENPWRRASENTTYKSPMIQAPSEIRARTIALVAGYESRRAYCYTTCRPAWICTAKCISGMDLHCKVYLRHGSALQSVSQAWISTAKCISGMDLHCKVYLRHGSPLQSVSQAWISTAKCISGMDLHCKLYLRHGSPLQSVSQV